MAPDRLATVDTEALLARMRPKLHRYCARMVGSVIDGEDVLQDALIKEVEALHSAEEVEMIADQLDDVESRQIAATSLRTFMRLPVAQRSSVILMDVLGCSLQEICEVMHCSLPAAKAALHRGRAQCAKSPTSRRTPRKQNCRMPTASASGPMWRISTRAT